MNILITDAFGFVGTNLSKTLSTAFQHHWFDVDLVQLVAQSPPVYPVGCNPFWGWIVPPIFEYVSWDKLHTPDKKKIDAIIHLAGKARDTKNTTEEQTYFDINVGLTEKIFEYFLQSGASKFIFFSSVKAAAAGNRTR